MATPSMTPDQVANMYRNVIGRDPEQAGADYWLQQSATMSPQDVYNQFYGVASEHTGGKLAGAGMTWEQALAPYQGSTGGTQTGNITDDWFRNTMGRDPTAQESEYWAAQQNASDSVQGMKGIYSQFQQQYGATPGFKTMDITDAWRLNDLSANGGVTAGTGTGTGGIQNIPGPANPPVVGGPGPGLDPGNVAQAPVTSTGAAAQAGANTIDMGQIVTPDAVTAEDRLTGILNRGSDLMTANATSGQQQAAGRGLLNSSMGIQAAQTAMIQGATPIAQSDANAINQMASQNAAASNSALTQNANFLNQLAQFNAGQTNTLNQFNTSQSNAMNQWNAGQLNEATMKQMDINSRETLAGIEANYKQLMQVNSSAENMFNQAMKNINEIQLSKDVTDKETAINSQLAWLRSGLTMTQNLNGVTGLVTF